MGQVSLDNKILTAFDHRTVTNTYIYITNKKTMENVLEKKLKIIAEEHAGFFNETKTTPLEYIQVINTPTGITFNTDWGTEHKLPNEIRVKMNKLINSFDSDYILVNDINALKAANAKRNEK